MHFWSARSRATGTCSRRPDRMPLPDLPPGTIVQLNSGGLALQRKLARAGARSGGITFADSQLTAAEAAGTFTWLGTDDGR